MALTDKLWEALATVIKMNDKLTGLAATTSAHQTKIEDLTARVIRLETALEIALSARVASNQRQLSPRARSKTPRNPDT